MYVSGREGGGLCMGERDEERPTITTPQSPPHNHHHHSKIWGIAREGGGGRAGVFIGYMYVSLNKGGQGGLGLVPT